MMAVMYLFSVTPHSLLELIEKPKKFAVRTDDLPAEIEKLNVTNTKEC
jgi:hypothetical protein